MGQSVSEKPLRKYVVIREHLRTLLRDAAPGTCIPSERQLVAQFDVARMTVRQAIDALVAEGFLERIPGRGTFVASPPQRTAAVRSFAEAAAERGQTVSSATLLLRAEQAGPGVARALGVEPGDRVHHWKRLRFIDGDAVCIQDIYLPGEIAARVFSRGEPASFYAALALQGRRPTWSEDTVAAIAPSDDDCLHLQLTAPEPVLSVSRRARCGDDVVEVSRSIYRSARMPLYLQFANC